MRYRLFYLICICFLLQVLFAEDKDDKDTAITMSNQQRAQLAMANPDYRVLPGDIYQLGYSGGVYRIVVDASGLIRISNLGSVQTRGKTFIAVKKQVEALILQNYPLNAVQFVLVSPSNFTVTIQGEVNETVEVNAWGLTRVSQILEGQLTDFASKRYLSIVGISGKTTHYDLFKAIRDGDLSQNPYVSPGDVITIPRVKRLVTLSGAVERPGTYELEDAETLPDLIERYGNGYLEGVGADKAQVKIIRTKDDGTAVPNAVFIDMTNEAASFQLLHKDTVHVESRQVLETKIYIEMPAIPSDTEKSDTEKSSLKKIKILPLSFIQGDDFVSLVRKYASLFTAAVTADMTGAYISRQGMRLPINLNRILFDAAYNENIPIEAGDRLIVPEIEQTVTVNGAVTRPGSYPYTPGRKADFYINLAGGFDDERNSRGAVIIKDVYGNKLAKDDMIGPNTVITARSNAFLYNFKFYVPLLTIVFSTITAVISILSFTKR